MVRRSVGEAPSVTEVVDVDGGAKEGRPDRLCPPTSQRPRSPRAGTRRAPPPSPGALLDVGHEARERQDRIRHDVAVVAGVDRRGLPVVGDDVDREQAAHAHHEGGGVSLLRPVRADEDARGEPVAVGAGDRLEVGAAVLFLAVEDDLDLPPGGAGTDRVHRAEDVREVLALLSAPPRPTTTTSSRARSSRLRGSTALASTSNTRARTARTSRPATASAPGRRWAGRRNGRTAGASARPRARAARRRAPACPRRLEATAASARARDRARGARTASIISAVTWRLIVAMRG